MKPTKKKELQQNQLAVTIGRIVRGIKPYQNYMLAILVIAAGVYLFVKIKSGRDEAREAKAWPAYVAAIQSDDGSGQSLSDVAKEYGSSSVAPLALAGAGCRAYEQGRGKLVDEPEEAQRLLGVAERRFKEVLDRFGDNDLAAQMALLGLANVHETRGDLDGARQHLQRLQEKYPDTPYAAQAKSRLVSLADPAATAFYQRIPEWQAEAAAAATQAADSQPDEPESVAAATQAADSQPDAPATASAPASGPAGDPE